MKQTSQASRKYYSLMVIDADGAYIAFGDYDRQCVKEEQEEYAQDGIKTKILVTGDTQEEVMAAFEACKNSKLAAFTNKA